MILTSSANIQVGFQTNYPFRMTKSGRSDRQAGLVSVQILRFDDFFAHMIGIGGRLATPPLPHHRAYGSRTTAVRSI